MRRKEKKGREKREGIWEERKEEEDETGGLEIKGKERQFEFGVKEGRKEGKRKVFTKVEEGERKKGKSA